MFRVSLRFAVALTAIPLLTGCAEQPLDAPLPQQVETDPVPSPPLTQPEILVDMEDSQNFADDVTSDPPAKSPLQSVFNALKVGTAEALDETAAP